MKKSSSFGIMSRDLDSCFDIFFLVIQNSHDFCTRTRTRTMSKLYKCLQPYPYSHPHPKIILKSILSAIFSDSTVKKLRKKFFFPQNLSFFSVQCPSNMRFEYGPHPYSAGTVRAPAQCGFFGTLLFSIMDFKSDPFTKRI